MGIGISPLIGLATCQSSRTGPMGGAGCEYSGNPLFSSSMRTTRVGLAGAVVHLIPLPHLVLELVPLVHSHCQVESMDKAFLLLPV